MFILVEWDLTGFYMDLMGFHGISRDLMEFNGISWDRQAVLMRFLHGFCRFH